MLPYDRVSSLAPDLEPDLSFSASVLWKLQREYFENAGVSAWSTHTVPLYVTNNPALARSYAWILSAWIEEQADAQPISIVELGAGSGRFSFLLLRQLELLFEGRPRRPFRYILTDFAPKNVTFCRAHPQLQPFRERGWLDFAIFDAERDCCLKLLDSGIEIRPGDLHTPLLAIANYVFDGLENDVFHVRDGCLSEVRLTRESLPASTPDLSTALDAVLEFRAAPVRADHYPPEWQELLRKHAECSEGAAFLFPIGALKCLNALQRLTNSSLTLLATDQFRNGQSFLDADGTPRILFHGSISVAANFPIIRDYFEQAGGFGMMPPFNYSNVVSFAGGTHTPSPRLRTTIRQAFEVIGPDLFFTMRRALEPQLASISVIGILSMLRALGFDPYVLEQALPSLQEQIVQAMPIADEVRADLLAVMDGCWANYYSFGEQCELPRRSALLMYGIGEYARAFDFFSREQQLLGASPKCLWNLGLCLVALNDFPAALDYFARAREMSKEFVAPCLST